MNNKIKRIKRHILIDCGNFTFCVFFKAYSTYEDKYKVSIEGDVSLDESFLKIMKEQYESKTKWLRQRYKTSYAHMIFVKDTPSEVNWRKKIYPDYKSNRGDTKYCGKTFNLGNLFKKVYSEILPYIAEKYNTKIIQIPNAEADDVISVLTKYLPENIELYIISSDLDYLQLLTRRNLFIYNPNGIFINQKLGGKHPMDKLLEKILYGDKSDNIPMCIPDLTITDFYMQNPKFLYDAVITNSEFMKRYRLNRYLIDFNYIPQKIKESVVREYLKKFEEKCKLETHYEEPWQISTSNIYSELSE
jgi:5'-3' exonuclease